MNCDCLYSAPMKEIAISNGPGLECWVKQVSQGNFLIAQSLEVELQGFLLGNVAYFSMDCFTGREIHFLTENVKQIYLWAVCPCHFMFSSLLLISGMPKPKKRQACVIPMTEKVVGGGGSIFKSSELCMLIKRGNIHKVWKLRIFSPPRVKLGNLKIYELILLIVF